MTTVSFTRLLQKERFVFFRDKTNVAVLALLALCMVIAAWNGVRNANLAGDQAEAAIQADADAFSAKSSLLREIIAGDATPGAWNDPRKAHQGVLHAKRPLTPWPAEMRFLSAETDPLTPALIEVGMSTRHSNPDPVFGDPSQRLDGPFDLVFVVVWLSPLFAILLCYDVLARDRELGQARILATQNTSLRRIVIARLTVRFVGIALIIAGIVTVALVISPGAGPASFAGAAAWHVGLLLFMGFWFSLAALVNARSRNAAAAGQMLVAVWAGLTLILPLLIGVAAKHASPPIDRFETILEYRALSNELNHRSDEVARDFFSAGSADESRAALGDEYSQYFVTVFYPMQLAFDERYRAVGAAIEEKRVRQAQTLRLGAFASPVLAMKLLSDDLAGSAPERRVWFLRAVDAYQDRWRAAFDRKITEVLPMTVEDYETKPEFASLPESLEHRWARIVGLLAALGTAFALVASMAWRALKHATP